MIYRFRVLQSSWGIAIDLSLRISYPDRDTLNGVAAVADDIYLLVTDKHNKPSTLNWLHRGIADIAHQLQQHKEAGVLCIEVAAIHYSPADFQPEGLYHAVQDAVLSYFGLDLKEHKISFNKEQNRYCFHDLETGI
ncbi:MAG: hypothetical protein EOP49_29770 [Sphingobacteriales bacterium]|nr:MAG: hypothetical protein EOP49_29770 [Sphingobacteriales bacterium]